MILWEGLAEAVLTGANETVVAIRQAAAVE
jgi:hypothetical protein